ncbi:tetratricopeptide repeat protein, partial [Calidithermus chliarophilus]|uniref:tetratricopeptide repeat protein n=1 Tax=Calidithermus chliarophilus TaxID=52023 RepID=UPI00056479E5
GGEPGRATPWLLEAGAMAHRLGRFDDAVRFYEQALQTAADAAQRREAQVMLTYPLVALGRLGEAERLARDILEHSDDPHARIKALDALQTAAMWQGRHAEAEAAIEEALRLAEGAGDEELADEMRFSRGFILMRLGRGEEALEVLEPLLPRYRARPPSFERLHLFSVLGFAYGSQGRFAEAKALLHEALRESKAMGSSANQILAANDLQYTHNAEGTPAEGLPHAEEALALGNYVVTELLRSNVAYAYMLLGRPAEAAGHLEWLTRHAQDPNLLGMAWARLAVVRARLGKDPAPALARALEL